MKKTLLLIASLAIAGSGFSQTVTNHPVTGKIKGNIPRVLYEKDLMRTSDNAGNSTATTAEENVPGPVQARTASNGTNIGFTTYDLQSNNSVARRLINHGGNKLSAVWTSSDDGGPNYTNRGTRYNYFDGTSWGTQNTNRLEGSVRTGWPCIGDLGSGKEIIISHNPATYSFQQGKNAAIGSTSWSFGVSGADSAFCTGGGGIWPRMAISGASKNHVHILSNAGDTASSCKLSGVKGPMVYSRSDDEGLTWPVKTVTLPGYDSTIVLNGGGDEYDIDARDNIVAIVSGGLGNCVMLWKSIDNGQSFTRTFVDSMDFVPFDNAANPALNDSSLTNDGSVSVMIDEAGTVHVSWAVSMVWRNFQTGTSTPSTFYNHGFASIVHWDDLNKQSFFNNILSTANENVWDIYPETHDSIFSIGDSAFTSGGYRTASIATMPSIAGDDNGHLFIVFSMLMDADTDAVSSIHENFRDIWVVASSDHGVTWGAPKNLTCSKAFTLKGEEMFACAASKVDDNLHIMYQADDKPGSRVSLSDDSPVTNDINYLRVPITDILNTTDLSAGTCLVSGIRNAKEIGEFAVSDNYPNPFTHTTNFNVNLSKPADLTLTLTNVLGQTMMIKEFKNLSTGGHVMDINASNYPAGVYFYTVKSKGYSVTKKMIVQ